LKLAAASVILEPFMAIYSFTEFIKVTNAYSTDDMFAEAFVICGLFS